MILDESGSIAPYVNDVRAGVISFLGSFSQINSIGGKATLGLLKFSGGSSLINASPAGRNCLGSMCTLDTPYINSVTTYMNDNYDPDGCTNWGSALRRAFTTQWTIDGAGPVVVPDVVLFFTDGNPTVHDGTCNKDCNSNRERLATLGVAVGTCAGSHVGVGCYWSDVIKNAGIKIFLVGVGDIVNHVPNTALVAGPVAWDQGVATFSTSDYVLNAQYSALGAIFYNVAKGLCGCLQDQAPCNNLAGQPTCNAQSKFDARVQISTGPNSVGFPVNSVIQGYLYYDFYASPAVYAIEYLTAAGGLEQTTITNPCLVTRQIQCGSGQCYKVTDKSFTPRFFVASVSGAGTVADATSVVALTGLLPNAACAAGTKFKKGDVVAGQGQQIEYVWLLSGSICAARAQDGTLYEFFKESGKVTPGVNLRFGGTAPAVPRNLRVNPANAYDFKQLTSCSNPICTADVEVLFVIDQNFPSDTDYFNVLSYVRNIANTFNDANNKIRMGAYFNRASLRIPASGWQSQLVTFGSQVLAASKPNPLVAVNFYNTVTNAINSFWPSNPTALSTPRYLITIVGSADSHTWTAGEITNFNTLRNSRGIEAWAIGVGPGSAQLALLGQLADTPNNPAPLTKALYTHYDVIGTPNLLTTQYVDQAARMCPKADLCGGTCQGNCVCGVCNCPSCSTPSDKCQFVTCPAPTSGCALTDKRKQSDSAGGCIPQNPIPCNKYDCDAITGTCLTATQPCGANCGCPAVADCQFNDLTTCTGVCNPKPIICGNNFCSGFCRNNTCQNGAVVCDDNNGCTVDRCVVRVIAGTQQGICEFVDDTQNKCPPTTACTVTNCTPGATSQAFTCTATNLTNLIDLCGVCLGDFTSCFLANIPGVSVGGLAGGIIAAIVIAAVIAAVLIALLSRKGYQAYQAKSAMASAGAKDNALFRPDGNAGTMA